VAVKDELFHVPHSFQGSNVITCVEVDSVTGSNWSGIAHSLLFKYPENLKTCNKNY
jgi:hypothetical protein